MYYAFSQEPYYLEITEPSPELKEREFNCIWSTGAGRIVQGGLTGGKWFTELLTDPESVRLDYMNSGHCPVNLGHRGKQIGIVVENSAYIEDGKGFATIRFSNDSHGKKIMKEVKNGSRSKAVSIIARLFDYIELPGKSGALPIHLHDEWEVNELALVDQGADCGARILI